MILLFIGLIIFRLLSLSFFLSLIYSVAIIITFIFLIMILDQSEILLRENYNFIPLGLLIILGVTGYLAQSICHDSVLSGKLNYLFYINATANPANQIPTYLPGQLYFIFTSSAMGKTTKVNKDMSLANNLILENDLSVLSVRLYTDINGILFILGLTLFISLVNSFLLFPWVVRLQFYH